MEKLKNMINPGSKKDDEVMYGSGQSDDPVHTGTGLTGAQSGQGSHFGGSRTAANDPLSNPTNRAGGSQYDSGSSTGPGTHGLSEPYASRMPGGFDDDAATTASVRSGVPGQTTQTGSGMTGTNDPNFSNKPLHDQGSAGSGLTGSGNNTPVGSSLVGNTRGGEDSGFGDQSKVSSHPGRDAALGAGAVGAGTAAHHHHVQGNTHGSSLTGNDYPDRSVPSSGLGNESPGSSYLGRDAALGPGAVGAGAAAHHHHESAQRDNYAPESGRSFPLGGSSNTGTDLNHLSRQTGTQGVASQNTSGSHSSNLANKADPRVDSDLDGSHAVGNAGYGSRIGANSRSGNQGSLGHDAALGAGTGAATGGLASRPSGYGPESWRHDHDRHGHQYEGDPCERGENTPAGPHLVQGPHATDTANRLDPHVAGGTGGNESTTAHHGHHGHGHNKEHAAMAGGATVTEAGASEGNHDHRGNTAATSTGAELGSSDGPAPNTAGPHKSDMLNKLDPRVDSDLSKQRGSTHTGLGSSTTGTSDPDPSQASGRDHHHRGAEAATGGSGLTGAAAYEDRKHHNSNESAGTISGPGSSNRERSGLGNTTDTAMGTGRDHHVGRDATLGAGAGGLAYEAERHHGKPTESTSAPSNTAGPTGYDQAGSQLAGSSQQPLTGQAYHHSTRDAGFRADPSVLSSTPQDQLAGSGHQSGRDHHFGRDAAVGGAALGVGAAGVDEHQKFRDTGRVDPGTNVHEHQHPGASPATYPSPGYGNERDLHQDAGHHGHRKEKEALAGGAAAGVIAHHEHSEHDEKAFEEEHSKEIKQHNKALAKEEKAIEKDEKHHEKERAKHMAAIEKDRKKHEHEAKKHEHDGEKKHGGLLGFLHKDKHDKNVDHPQESVQVAHDRRGVDDGTSTGTEAGSYDQPLEGQYGSQSGVHDSSLGGTGPSTIGSGATTHDAYGTHEGHNKLHKDPPAKVLEARGQDYQGHGNVK